MAKRKNNNGKSVSNSATVGYEAELWRMADALRGSMDAAEYKHVVLGLIFLKYISDAFEELHKKLEAERAQGADPEDPDEYRAQNIFWVPPEARWSHLKAQARQLTIGQLVDDAMAAIERDKSGRPLVGARHASPLRDRRGDILFMDARRMGRMVDRTHRELTDEDMARIAKTYHAWRSPGTRDVVGARHAVPLQSNDGASLPEYQDNPGFCKWSTLDEVRRHGHVLTPGRYVGAPPQEDDGEPFEEKMARLVAQLKEQQAEAARLDAAIAENLKHLGFWNGSP